MAATAAAAAATPPAAAEKEASQQSSLGAYSPVDYMSITSFPRLPEDEAAAAAGAESCLRSRKEEDAFLGEQDTDNYSTLNERDHNRTLDRSGEEMESLKGAPLMQEEGQDPLEENDQALYALPMQKI